MEAANKHFKYPEIIPLMRLFPFRQNLPFQVLELLWDSSRVLSASLSLPYPLFPLAIIALKQLQSLSR